MKSKPALIALGIMLVIGGAFTYLLLAQSKPAKTTTAVQPAAEQPKATAQQPAATARPGTYTDYTSGSIASIAGTKLLFFHAPWCPQCRKLEASIKAGQIPDNVTILKVDYDSNQELRKQYGVTIQTTLVRVDDNGNQVKKYVAYDDPTLDAVTTNLLQ